MKKQKKLFWFLPTTNYELRTNRGQSLVMLLIFIAVAVSITTAAVTLLITSGKSITRFEEGAHARRTAESAAENAFLRLLRNPNYTGETLTIDGVTTTTTVSGVSPKIITAVATGGDWTRTIEVSADYVGGLFTITSWQEIP